MGFLVNFVLGKVSGPFLVYILLALFAANAATGWLLKNAWADNARAALECENQALRDANAAKELVAAELVKIQKELVDERAKLDRAANNADTIIARVIAANEARDADEKADLEVAVNEITDTDYFCGSESVPFPILVGLRVAATAYNQARNNTGSGIPPSTN